MMRTRAIGIDFFDTKLKVAISVLVYANRRKMCSGYGGMMSTFWRGNNGDSLPGITHWNARVMTGFCGCGGEGGWRRSIIILNGRRLARGCRDIEHEVQHAFAHIGEHLRDNKLLAATGCHGSRQINRWWEEWRCAGYSAFMCTWDAWIAAGKDVGKMSPRALRPNVFMQMPVKVRGSKRARS